MEEGSYGLESRSARGRARLDRREAGVRGFSSVRAVSEQVGRSWRQGDCRLGKQAGKKRNTTDN